MHSKHNSICHDLLIVTGGHYTTIFVCKPRFKRMEYLANIKLVSKNNNVIVYLNYKLVLQAQLCYKCTT